MARTKQFEDAIKEGLAIAIQQFKKLFPAFFTKLKKKNLYKNNYKENKQNIEKKNKQIRKSTFSKNAQLLFLFFQNGPKSIF